MPTWGQLMPDFVMEILKPFLGAVVGVVGTFVYNRRNERNKRKVALRDAQFALIARINNLICIYRQHLASQINNPNRWIELPPVMIAATPPSVPLEQLNFLLDDVAPNVLHQIVIARDKYDTICQVIKLRNERHEEFQRLYERHKISKRLSAQLKDLTDEIYEQLPEALQSLDALIGVLAETMRKHFKGVKILQFDVDVERVVKELQKKGLEESTVGTSAICS